MSGPLSGYTVVDFGRVAAGPFAATILGDLGAKVIKIEDKSGDFTRRAGLPEQNGYETFFVNVNRGKRMIAVDLRSPNGREVALDVLAHADAMVSNFRPGVLQSMGLSYDQVKRRNPGIVYVEVNGFGTTGPYSERPAYEGVVQGLSGVAGLQQDPVTGAPTLIQTALVDNITALMAAQAVTAGLLERTRTGSGQRIEVPMLDAMLYFLWPASFPALTFPQAPVDANANRPTGLRSVATKDGYVTYMAVSHRQLLAILDVIRRPELRSDDRFSTPQMAMKAPNLHAHAVYVDEMTSDLSSADFISRMNSAGVPCGPVYFPSELLDDPHIRAEDLLHVWTHPDVGAVRSAIPPFRLNGRKVMPMCGPPELGLDGEAILREYGWSDERIRELVDGGDLIAP